MNPKVYRIIKGKELIGMYFQASPGYVGATGMKVLYVTPGNETIAAVFYKNRGPSLTFIFGAQATKFIQADVAKFSSLGTGSRIPFFSFKGGGKIYKPTERYSGFSNDQVLQFNFDMYGNMLVRQSYSYEIVPVGNNQYKKKYRFGPNRILLDKFEITLIKREFKKAIEEHNLQKLQEGKQ